MMTQTNNKTNQRIWLCGIPGSKWSGIDIQLRQILPCDRTDETADKVQYHRAIDPLDKNNGHRGSYWGPGMGCGEEWVDFNYLKPHKILDDIDNVFHGTGYKIIKSHFFARHFNLDYIWNHFPGDYIIFVYREPQKSFAWWSEVMDFAPDHYPDYRPGYTDYNTMRNLLWKESAKIIDFTLRKNIPFHLFKGTDNFSILPGFKKDVAKAIEKDITIKNSDLYIAIEQIPNKK